MSETTETICHWEQVQRRWKWEWASYHPHPTVYWTAEQENGMTELVDDATLAPEAPELRVDLTYGSRWEKVSGTGTNVIVETADLSEGVEPVGEGWSLAVPVGD